MGLLEALHKREITALSPCHFRGLFDVHSGLLSRLGLSAELEGHEGCVNCLHWNERGTRILSGSDDLRLNLWDPFAKRRICSLPTTHTNNIFTAKFLPCCDDTLVVSGAGDHKIQLSDLTKQETLKVYTHHSNRVKRIDIARDEPKLFWSVAEDGLVLQYDLRCDTPVVLARLRDVEGKCLSTNPVRTNLIAVGANDQFVRIYDRRKISTQELPTEYLGTSSSYERKGLLNTLEPVMMQPGVGYSLQYVVAGHLCSLSKRPRQLTSTYVTFSPNGDEILVNMGGEQIYLFSLTFPQASLLSSSQDSLVKKIDSPTSRPNLSPAAADLKERANNEYNAKNFNKAIEHYNASLSECPHPVLYANRAAALIKRAWDGDGYLALRDCVEAVKLDPSYVKAHLRFLQCLVDLDYCDEASSYLERFIDNFPEHSHSSFVSSLEKEIGEKRQEEAKRKKCPLTKEEITSAIDFTMSFCGHCNTTTDIKEANFLGSDGNFVMGGSDDGKFFIWDRKTSNIVSIFEGDDAIVNCLQGHPSQCIVASSGIDPTVRIWEPFPENGCPNPRVVFDCESVSSANQRRMRADPFETLLMNMGYEVSMGRDDEQVPQCNPS